MSAHNLFKTDSSIEKDGIIIDYGDFWVKIARAGGANKDYQRAMEAKSKPYRRAIERESLPAEVAERILREVAAETLMLGWGGKEEGSYFPWPDEPDGLAPSVENYLRVFNELPEFFADVVKQANDFTLFRARALADEAKN